MFEVMFLMINREVCWHLVCTNQLEIGEKARLHPVQETFFNLECLECRKCLQLMRKKENKSKSPDLLLNKDKKKYFSSNSQYLIHIYSNMPKLHLVAL